MMATLDFAVVALAMSIAALVLAFPLLYLLEHVREVPPLLGFIILMLAAGGAVGAYGRLVDENNTLDYWVRVLVIATRFAAVGAMLYDIRWLSRRIRR